MVVGPGAYKGLGRLFNLEELGKEYNTKCSRFMTIKKHKDELVFNNKEKGALEPEMMAMAIACIKFLRDTADLWFRYFGLVKIDKTLNLMSIENCLCEISKYLRVY